MYGWRARIGLIVPSLNTTAEPEFVRHLPSGVSMHTARLALDAGTTEELREMTDGLDNCCERLATAGIDVLALGCTTSTILNGPERLEARMSERFGVPSVTTAASIVRAIEALGTDSIALATPYADELNSIEVDYLESAGVDIVALNGLGIPTGQEIGRRFPESAYRQVASMDRQGAEAVVISCANYRTDEITESLEGDLGKPVVTSNQALLWDALERTEVEYGEIPLGTLFEEDVGGA
jgi:maleate isomerase